MIELIVIGGLVAIFIGIIILILMLSEINKSIHILTQIVAIGIQKSGLVHTPEEVQEDLEKALEEDEERIEPQKRDIPADTDEETLVF